MCGLNPCDKPDCTWSQEWLKKCEARKVLKMPKNERAKFYELVQKHRGKPAMLHLIQAVKEEYENQK